MCHIENFAVERLLNGFFHVEWEAINADKVTVNGIDVTGKDSFTVCVPSSETILLRAENATSFDVKEAFVVYGPDTIYKDRVVTKKVRSPIKAATIIFLIVFIIISAVSLHYAYQLEDRNYSGERFLSDIFGYKSYLLVNGSNESRTVNVPAQGASLIYDVKTNAAEYEVLDLPNWCSLEQYDSLFIIHADRIRQGKRTATIRIKTRYDEVTMCLEQVLNKARRLLVNYEKAVDTQLGASSGQVTYQVNTDADSYEITSLPAWAKIVARGSKSFTISYEENPKSIERTDWFKVKAEGMEVKIKLTQAAQKITGQIKDVRIEHNVYIWGSKGMKIFVDFTVQYMKGIEGRCMVYMYYEDGTPLKGYRTTDGQCVFGRYFIPRWDDSIYTGFELFIPYKFLETGKGEHNMKLSCTIWEMSTNNGTAIAQSDYHSFTLRKKR